MNRCDYIIMGGHGIPWNEWKDGTMVYSQGFWDRNTNKVDRLFRGHREPAR